MRRTTLRRCTLFCVTSTPVVIKRVVLALAAFGSFMPWVTLGPARVTGTSTTEGMLTLVAAGIGLLLTFSTPVDPKAKTFELVIVLTAVVCPALFYLNNFSGNDELAVADPGFGLLICIPASLVWLGFFLWGSRRSPRYRRNRPPRRLDDWG